LASDTILDEIKLMARADHAYRLPRENNPYAEGDPRAAAWIEGWQAEDDRVHRLDEEIVKLPRFRVLIEIVSGSDVLAALDREELANYRVSNLNAGDTRSVTYESDEARARFPESENVLIRVTNEDEGGMFD
jgi:hypothetical protein